MVLLDSSTSSQRLVADRLSRCEFPPLNGVVEVFNSLMWRFRDH